MAQLCVIPPLGLTDQEWSVMPLPLRVLHVARSELGTEESPAFTDRGPRVDAILRSARSTPGNPWAAAFITWCCLWSSWTPFSDEPGAGVMYPASVVSWISWARKRGRLKDGAPGRGDLFVIDRPGACRIGVVDQPRGRIFDGIAGDSSGCAPGEGFGVLHEAHAVLECSYISLEGIPCR